MRILKLLLIAIILFQSIPTQTMGRSEDNAVQIISDFGQIAIVSGAMENLGEIIECIPLETIANLSAQCAKSIFRNTTQLFTHPGYLFLLAMAAVEQQSRQ